MPENVATRATAGLFLAALVLLGLNLKVRLSTSHPRFDANNETGYYRTESALQYRYARMLSQGRSIPELDTAAQYPEGIRTRRELTSLMERLVAASYRALTPQGANFRWFTILWVAFVSSLSIVAFYFCALRLTRMQAVALAGAAAYGLSWAAQVNVIAAFRLETLGLPLIFASLACCAAVLDPEEKRPHAWGCAAAGFLLLAFAAWHLSRFYLGTYFVAAGWAWWRQRAQDRTRLKLALAYPACAAALSLALVPSARESLFIASPDAYGHVYGLIYEKLRHGLRPPADPSALSPVMRLDWTGPGNSPDLGFALFAFLPLALLAVPRLWGKAPRSAFGDLIDGLLVIYACATLLSSRMLSWLSFFLVLAALRQRSRWLIAGLAAVAALEGFKSWAPSSPYNPIMRLSAAFTSTQPRPGISFSVEQQLLSWLKRQAGPDRPTLASMGLSATILAYAETPVLLQPKWEARGIREKTADFSLSLFQNEAAFSAYARKHGAKLFVYSTDAILDETPEGLRYASGSFTLRPDAAAFLFHFKPESLKNFSLLFENESFRVFGLDAPATLPPRKSSFPVYDLARYNPAPQPDGTIVLEVAGVLRRMEAARLQLLLGRVLTKLGRHRQALSAYERSFLAWPGDASSRAEYDALRAHVLVR